jgi:DNA-directed RNA polymerase subunit RPC12/RpoP
MYCSKCGYEAKDGEKFCVKCGAILNDTTSKKTIKLTCEDCGGEMNIEAGRNVLTCPYCGSKKLIAESDEVTIARINKEADAERMRFEKEKREYEEELRAKKNIEDTKSTVTLFSVFVIVTIVMVAICLVLSHL